MPLEMENLTKVQAIEQGLELLQARDSGTFTDSFGLPEGTMQQIMQPIYEKYAPFWFVNYIPLDPLSAPGVDSLTYPRVDYYGEMTYSQAEAETNVGRVDIGIKNVGYNVKRARGYFEMSTHEADKLAFFLSRNNVVGAIDLMNQKRQAADLSYMSERETALCEGRPELGIYGILSHPDVQRVVLDSPLDQSNTPDENIAVLSMLEEIVITNTNGVFTPGTLLIPPKNFSALKNQPRSSLSDTSVLRWWIENYGAVQFDDSSRSFEIDKSPRLQSVFPNGNSAAILFCRRTECVRQVVPKNVTYGSPIPKRGGYEIDFHADITGVQIMHPRSVVVVEFPNA